MALQNAAHHVDAKGWVRVQEAQFISNCGNAKHRQSVGAFCLQTVTVQTLMDTQYAAEPRSNLALQYTDTPAQHWLAVSACTY